MIRPGDGRKPRATSSALIRHSIACPRSTTSSCVDRERLARRDEDLLADDVDPGHRLRDRVLDLDARVHLEEEVLAVGREQPLDRPGRPVVDGASRVDRESADARAELGPDGGRRRLLDELLVAALDRAVALAEMDDVAVRVREDLHLDVARVVEVALDVHGGVGEVRLAFPHGRLEGPLDLVRRCARRAGPFRPRRPTP